MRVQKSLEHRATDKLALADQLGVPAAGGLVLVKSMAQPVRPIRLLAGQDLVGGCASLAQPELGADEIGRLLGHQAIGGQLAANDRHEVVDPIPGTMVDHRMGTRDGPDVVPSVGLRGALILVERPDAGVGPEEAHPGQLGKQSSSLHDEFGHLGSADLIAIRVLNMDLGGAQDRDGVDRDHDVAIAWSMAAVDDRVGHALVEDEHRALARGHRQLDPGQARNLPGPGTRRGHESTERHSADRPGADVRDLGREQPLARSVEPDQSVVGTGLATPTPRVGQVGLDQLPRLHGRVRHTEGTPNRRVEGRLPAQEVPHGHLLARHAAGRAGARKVGQVVVGVARGGHEVTAGVLDAGGCDPAQDAILVDALAGGQRVLGDIPPTRMEQAVVTTARAAAHVALLDEQAAQAAPGEVAQQPCPGGSTTDDEHIDRGELSHRLHPAPMFRARWAWSARGGRSVPSARSTPGRRSVRSTRATRPPRTR